MTLAYVRSTQNYPAQCGFLTVFTTVDGCPSYGGGGWLHEQGLLVCSDRSMHKLRSSESTCFNCGNAVCNHGNEICLRERERACWHWAEWKPCAHGTPVNSVTCQAENQWVILYINPSPGICARQPASWATEGRVLLIQTGIALQHWRITACKPC